MTELPPMPKMSPSAIMKVKMGAHKETPATRFVFIVLATKYVSAMLYTKEITMLKTTGKAIVK